MNIEMELKSIEASIAKKKEKGELRTYIGNPNYTVLKHIEHRFVVNGTYTMMRDYQPYYPNHGGMGWWLCWGVGQ